MPSTARTEDAQHAHWNTIKPCLKQKKRNSTRQALHVGVLVHRLQRNPKSKPKELQVRMSRSELPASGFPDSWAAERSAQRLKLRSFGFFSRFARSETRLPFKPNDPKTGAQPQEKVHPFRCQLQMREGLVIGKYMLLPISAQKPRTNQVQNHESQNEQKHVPRYEANGHGPTFLVGGPSPVRWHKIKA